ncbi:hypothetical protein [Clostridium senegalense]|uniref:hypothetical protein n=1 Tax=Clostridium senegalense TaxID=1465809 RepID=UPI000289EEBD|nr:hypothetical protein [Clostridium senegalense]
MKFTFLKIIHSTSLLGIILSFLLIILESFNCFILSHNQVVIFTLLFIASFGGLVFNNINTTLSDN